jgi:hypothetical protein
VKAAVAIYVGAEVCEEGFAFPVLEWSSGLGVLHDLLAEEELSSEGGTERYIGSASSR